jgi:hypothetical protein
VRAGSGPNANPAIMAVPSSTRVGTRPMSRPVNGAAAKEAGDSARNPVAATTNSAMTAALNSTRPPGNSRRAAQARPAAQGEPNAVRQQGNSGIEDPATALVLATDHSYASLFRLLRD